jgi:hypothetical protein
MKSTTELINDLTNSSATVRSDAAHELGQINSFSAISPLIQALEREDDLVVYNAIITALEAISLHFTDPEDRGRDVRQEELDVNDPAQAKLQGLRQVVFNAKSVADKHRAISLVLDGWRWSTYAVEVDLLWGDRRAVGYLLNLLKKDDVGDDLAEDIISSLFRISDDDRPDSIRVLSLA